MHERANLDEKPIVFERAKGAEKTNSEERAKVGEKPSVFERSFPVGRCKTF
jgi:hypothetical protein